ncbi:hypothetical protein AVEN_194983-1 [Araneus ventricosus]|uniref:Uncharacterized protein n=1 Tax=Araneus ventricosus TaxID=182803 RepID=A0A4Y2QPF2_ARAVE|nr:hypothetical protein AVEN_54892-1 [Araneus ventricosus]GBN65193.1 hypothetical protein AVEN_194983-1 [Araneus ventricosus]
MYARSSSLCVPGINPNANAEVMRNKTETIRINPYCSESIPVVRSQEPVAEPASDFQSSKESSSDESVSRSSDKGSYRTRYDRVVKPPSHYVAKFYC